MLAVLLPLLHGLLLVTYLALRWVAGEAGPDIPVARIQRLWLGLRGALTLLAEFTPFLFLPLPLWLLTAALARTRAALVAAAFPWLIFAWLYGELFVPRVPAAQPTQTTLRVMTHNVLASSRPADDLIRTIAGANPDVLLVQELTPGLAAALDGALAARYPHRRLRPGGWDGMGLWSRYPLVSEEQWNGSILGAHWQHAVLDVSGRRLHVVNLHLNSPRTRWRPVGAAPVPPVPIETSESLQRRDVEVGRLVPRLRALADGPEATLVAGDFNLTDQTPEYGEFRSAGFGDAFRSAGWGFGTTFPVGRTAHLRGLRFPIPVPLVRIDYVLYSPAIAVQGATVWPAAGGSDHLPVVTDLALR
jgi:endonuclease/exonuclease/phosphatase (EEP) superfamily protein YafD